MGVEHLKKTSDITPCKEHIIGPECEEVFVIPDAEGSINADNTVVYVSLLVVSVDMPDLSIGTGISVFVDTQYVYPYSELVDVLNDETVYVDTEVVNVDINNVTITTGTDVSVSVSTLVVNVIEEEVSVESGSDITVDVDTEVVNVNLLFSRVLLSAIVPVDTEIVNVDLLQPFVPEPIVVPIGTEEVVDVTLIDPVIDYEMFQVPSIAVAYTNNTTQTRTITISNIDNYPNPGSQLRIELYDTTNSVSLGYGIYNMGGSFNAPASSSGASWSLITSNSNNPTIANGMVWSLSLFDWLQDKGDYATVLYRDIEVRVKAIIGGSESVQGTQTFNHDHHLFKLNTTRTGAFSIGLSFNLSTAVIIDYGDGTNIITTALAYTLSKTYPSTASKNICVVYPATSHIGSFTAFGQNINSIDPFDVGGITTFRLNHQSGATTMTGISWDFDAPNCTYFQLSNSTTLTTLPTVFNLRPTAGTVTLTLGTSNYTSFGSSWGMTGIRNLDLSVSPITSLPLAWAPTGLVTVNFSGCSALTTLPAWTVNTLTSFTATSSALTGIPSSWFGSSVVTFNTATSTNFATFPDFNWSACTTLRADRNKFTSIPSYSNFASLTSLTIGNASNNNTFFTTWGPTSINAPLNTINFRRLTNFSQAELDDMLAQLKASWIANNRAILANFANCPAPSAAGYADKAFLNANGCTITTA